jgi:hypothetical protein
MTNPALTQACPGSPLRGVCGTGIWAETKERWPTYLSDEASPAAEK